MKKSFYLIAIIAAIMLVTCPIGVNRASADDSNHRYPVKIKGTIMEIDRAGQRVNISETWYQIVTGSENGPTLILNEDGAKISLDRLGVGMKVKLGAFNDDNGLVALRIQKIKKAN